jgi:orotate phosphoribosyltransferase
MTIIECDHLPEGSRLRAICDGSADLPSEKIDAYRRRMGLGPLYGTDAPPPQPRERAMGSNPKPTPPQTEKPRRNRGGCGSCGGGAKSKERITPPPNGWGPGSQLLKIFESAGVPHCQECLDLAARMDRWGKRGCRHRLDRIVREILPRARAWIAEERPFVHVLLSASRLEEAALRAALAGKIKRAIAAAPDRDPNARPRALARRTGRSWRSAFSPGKGLPPYLTVEDLARDAASLVGRLPPDITHVMGVARSGLVPATELAMMLHVPLTVIKHHQATWFPAGNGWRLDEGAPNKDGVALVVDDTVMTGNSLNRTKRDLEKFDGRVIYAAVYVNPKAIAKPDIWAADLPWPHLLEWNLFNSVLLQSFALDFDGILCRDCTPAEDDDGPRYLEFLRTAEPLNLVRKAAIPLVVTARLEKYREQTTDWMDRWNIKAKKLVMGPWATKADRDRDDVAAWKAEALRDFFARRRGIPPRMFIESDPRQAERIAGITGQLVVCPPARRCYR